MNDQPNKNRIIRLPEVIKRTGLPRSTIYDLMQRGEFPKQVNLCSTRAVGWVEIQVADWIESRIEPSPFNREFVNPARFGVAEWLALYQKSDNEISMQCRYYQHCIAAIQEEHRSQFPPAVYDALNEVIDRLDRAAYIADEEPVND